MLRLPFAVLFLFIRRYESDPRAFSLQCYRQLHDRLYNLKDTHNLFALFNLSVLQPVKPAKDFLMRGQEFADFSESAHDLDIDLNSPGAV